MPSNPLREFLKPGSVAIIGASRDPAKRGNRAIRALLDSGFAGRVLPINPRETEILGLPCYPDLAAAPGEIDLALICTPARTTPEVIEACGARGVKGAVVLAGGFGEATEEGAALEARTVEAARRHGLRIVGPNTNGIFDAHAGLNLVGWSNVPKGALGILSQSGNVAMSVMTSGIRNGHAGFSTFIGVGNESDVRFDEYLRFFGEDAETRAVVAYVEGFKDGAAFAAAAREVAPTKPVVLYKAGRTRHGQGAARSHSGSLAGDYAVCRGVLRQAGVIVVERSDEMFPVADMLARHAGKPARRVAVLSEGGGVISQAADALAERGLAMEPLGAGTVAALKAITPNATALSNPVDCGGATDPHPRYIAACGRAILADPAVDALLVVGFFGGYQLRQGELVRAAENDAARDLVAAAAEAGKPVVVQSHYAEFESEAIAILRAGDVPVLRSIEVAAACLAATAEYHAVRRRPAAPPWPAAAAPDLRVPATIAAARAAGRSALLEPEALRVLEGGGVRVPPHALLRSAAEIGALDPALRRHPVALKVVSKDILHKSDVGGVRLGVTGEAAIAEGMAGLLAEVRRHRPEAEIEGVLVMPMARRGVEVILGVTTDPQYGRVMMFGLGGVFVEALKDVVFRALPLSAQDAEAMLGEIKGRAVLEGARGLAVDRAALTGLMLRLSDLALAHPDLAEIDLNPVILDAEGCTVVDARMLLG